MIYPYIHGGIMPTYIYEFDIAAALLIAALIILLILRKNYPSTTNKLYMAMLIGNLFSTVMDLVTVYTLAHNTTIPVYVNYAVNIMYLISFNSCAVLYYIYTLVLTKENHYRRFERLLGISVLVIDVLLVATTPLTKLVIYFDKNNSYCHGPLMPVLYVTALFLLVYSMYLALRYRRNLTRFQLVSVLSFNLLIVIAVVLQFVMNDMLLQAFACALFLVVVYVSLQNPDDYMDKATGCYNGAAFNETLERYIAKKTPFKLVAFTLDDFQYINRILGIKEGNDFIDRISRRFHKEFGAKNVYHLHSCRYVIIPAGIQTTDDVIKAIHELFRKPISICGVDVQMTPCMCKLQYPDFAETAEDINSAIEYTLKSVARSNDKAVVTASADALKAKTRENQLIHIMKQAVHEQSFQVYYQPLYSVKDKKFTSAEALIRLIDKDLGFIPPDEFIPIAERNGMIIEIGEIVMRKVCSFLHESDLLDLGVQYVDVNLSTIQCMQETLARDLISIMEEYEITADRINFEITETAHSVNDATLRNTMETLIRAGSVFSMDDYGTGFSTANYLITLPMSVVKIDKSILWLAMKEENALTILRHTVQMLKDLSKRIVVEGVEDENMAQLLIDMGVDLLQGYHYSRPLPEAQYLEFVRSRN